MSCRKMNANIADLLFEPESVPAEVATHVEECADCASEIASLKATMKVLEDWSAPEPGAFFDAKLYARLRSESVSAPAGLFSRLHARLLYSSRYRMRQWAMGGLAALLAVGVGSFALLDHSQAPAVQASATVRDLQSFDGNAQLFQQLNALDGAQDNSSGASN